MAVLTEFVSVVWRNYANAPQLPTAKKLFTLIFTAALLLDLI